MDKEQIKELREIFRARMKRKDFCIGEEQVEILFRELLGEPEPVEPEHISTGPPISAVDFANAIRDSFSKEKVDQMFNRDTTFWKIKK